MDLSLASILALRGLPGDKIEAALRFRRGRLGLKKKAEDYYPRTVGKVLSVHSFESEFQKFIEALGVPMVTQGMADPAKRMTTVENLVGHETLAGYITKDVRKSSYPPPR